ncbi:hypothetical protein [uncultured Roseibium sp.]|uniref:hypothetical protein n=1 Tax=uncultured Roseibium sp. TaxID=1936171 RepID=UPI00261DE2AF|nr:hypothetical protein [uncultured Roseibium sp.]
MSTTGEGRRAPAQPRDTPEKSDDPFSLVLKLQSEHYTAEGLTFALSSVIDILSDTPGISPHPALLAADALIDALRTANTRHRATLEQLEMCRFGTGRAA